VFLPIGVSHLRVREGGPFQASQQKADSTEPGRGGNKPEVAQRCSQGCRKGLTMTAQNRVSCMMRSRNCQTGVRIHNLPRKVDRFKVTSRQVTLIIGLLIAFMGSGIGFVWSNHEKTQIGYDIAELKKEEMRLLEINRKLRLEIALLKSPANLEAHAVKRLGLRQPKPDQIVVLP